MQPHKGKRLCITGMPTAGKSYLAKKLAEKLGGTAILFDDFRESLASDERYRKWVNFYIDQDEERYYLETSPEDQWKNLVEQSEALWPAFLEEMDRYADDPNPVIFECVNLLPHLIKRDTLFPALVLIGSSYEETLERNRKDPRWGEEEHLLKLNSKGFFFIERPRYKKEGEKYDLPIFEKAEDAFPVALQLLKSSYAS